MEILRVTVNGHSAECAPEQWQTTCERLIAAHGPGVPQIERITVPDRMAPPAAPAGASTFGRPVMDDSARERIEAQHDALRASGVTIDTREQLYATGTRLADVGYARQRERAAEHEAKETVASAVDALVRRIEAEDRDSASFDFGQAAQLVEINGTLKVGGWALTENALRGLLARAGSPSTTYLLGLRDRCRTASAAGNVDLVRATKAHMLETLRTELKAASGERPFVLRVRHATRDAFACVSEAYVPADAPSVMPRVLDAFGGQLDARATWDYDPVSTAWEIRADVLTPTPVDQQAVGEPFRAYASIASRDDGNGSLTGGGGIELLRCLNASTYVADGQRTRRRHVGRIHRGIDGLISHASRALHTLCDAWGRARQTPVPSLADELAAAEQADFQKTLQSWFLGAIRTGELAGVLPGRTEEHARGLALAYVAERRDPDAVVRADVAQAWTRYIQGQPAGVRREGERAIASWIVAG